MKNIYYALGDVHGAWGQLNSLMNKLSQKNPNDKIIILQVGDFAWIWGPTFHSAIDENGKSCYEYSCTPAVDKIKIPDNIELYWVPGNHENWSYLEENFSRGTITEVQDRLFYCAPFSRKQFPEIGNVLFIGGAYSIDKEYRIENESWWRNEVITNEDMDYFYQNTPENVDIIISHTCPNYFELKNVSTIGAKANDSSKFALDIVFDTCKPKSWFFGHYHRYQTGEYQNCKWTMLSLNGQTGWYERLE